MIVYFEINGGGGGWGYIVHTMIMNVSDWSMLCRVHVHKKIDITMEDSVKIALWR